MLALHLPHWAAVFPWLGYKDSNLNYLIQSQAYYRYTIPHHPTRVARKAVLPILFVFVIYLCQLAGRLSVVCRLLAGLTQTAAA